MNNPKKFALAALAAAMGLTATAAQAETQTGDAYARILRQLTINKTADLDFATIVVGSSASTVQVGRNADDSADSSVCGPNLTCIGTRTTAKFDLQGSNSQTVLIRLPAPTVTLSLQNPPTGVTGPTSMTSTLQLSTDVVTLTQGPGAVGGSFAVGGILAVNAQQAEGSYKGSFDVEAVYQ